MAFNPSPKVADCRDIARKWNRQMVIIIGLNETGEYEWASYGETKQLCDSAKEFAEAAELGIINHVQDLNHD